MSALTFLPTSLAQSMAPALRFDAARCAACRQRMLAEGVFEGSAVKPLLRVPYRGGTIEGIFERPIPAAARIWSVSEGVIDVPIAGLPEDLVRCFEDEEVSKLRATLGKVVAQLDCSTAMLKEMSATVKEWEAEITEVSRTACDMIDTASELILFVASENGRLRARLGLPPPESR